jgi:predicted nucleic acid-binding protein
MILIMDASVAIKWFVDGQWGLAEDHIEPALDILRASANGDVEFFQPPHFLAEVAAVLTRLTPMQAQQHVDDLAAMNITWAQPKVAYAKAIELAHALGHHLFDTLYHALALSIPGAVLITADRRYFAKAKHLDQIAYLPDWGAI